ncbi:ABC transporter ATP-binding protein [Paracoccus sp. P2]|uniref:ATP-binding cassette domain-containing protein n=1 Tax=Paracoccus pantotrophus TaxID=82367 RepID=A0A1I5HDR9_PARPN|nr:ATP-binding cassette domain-containing protein [Paracoccus pantotrophus]MDF3853579.1 ATP-binding cassette domain-containing protein [Paracoccus pantotrophus]QFG37910.1 ATP-binding cassette domain-containing protein [Paracoccus pantotrophus]QLH15462.1 ATP-binding cassette domain-containing protein [Paracoccus pantotrophus]RDD99209.1 ABC transporter ATP-binding protein [Paracoccus pantotrophus]RKS51608.1 putative spermidine/putrescine transport system ATP-binding protein [Paracoccus pantotrop
MSFLTLDHLQKSFGPTRVVHDFDLGVEKGEFVSFLGPSGCGKTTVLRMVAGFETPTAGRVVIDGRDVTRLRPNQRQIGMVFQSYALFPNLTVAENVGFGLRTAGVARAERAGRVAEMLALIGLPDLGGRYPWQLSGGQQQRVALARALAPRPRVLLLDEPLSALDAKIRVSLRNQIREIQQQLAITTIFVTHDQEEALSISDRIVVMHKGVADQTGTPAQIYNQPATDFVAGFVGTLNRFPAEVLDPARGLVRVEGAEIALDRSLPAGPITLAARPESLRIAPEGIPAEIAGVEFLGSVQRLRARVAGREVVLDRFNEPGSELPRPGARVCLAASQAGWLVLPG